MATLPVVKQILNANDQLVAENRVVNEDSLF